MSVSKMAEMTAAQARQLLQNPFDKRPRLLEIWSDKTNQIAALIEQQAAEIERLKCCGNCGRYLGDDSDCYKKAPYEIKCDKWRS